MAPLVIARTAYQSVRPCAPRRNPRQLFDASGVRSIPTTPRGALHRYPGTQHGFNNDTPPRYDAGFFKQRLAAS